MEVIRSMRSPCEPLIKTVSFSVRLVLSHSRSGSNSSNSKMVLFLHPGPAGDFSDHMGPLPQGYQEIGNLGGAQTDHLVPTALVWTQLEHVAQHGHLAPVELVEQV